MSNYRRTSKPKTEHIKKGFTVFQKTIATIGSILGLITATITIMNAMDNNKNNKKEPPTTQTTVVREIQKESPTDTNSPTQKQTPNQDTPQKEETQPSTSSSKEEKIKEDSSSKIEQKDASSPNTPTSETGTTASNGSS